MSSDYDSFRQDRIAEREVTWRPHTKVCEARPRSAQSGARPAFSQTGPFGGASSPIPAKEHGRPVVGIRGARIDVNQTDSYLIDSFIEDVGPMTLAGHPTVELFPCGRVGTDVL
jgi:hypothetical protein